MITSARTTVSAIVRGVIADYARSPVLLACVLVGMLYQVAFNLFLPLVTRHVFDEVLPAGDAAALQVVALALGGALLLRVIVAIVQERVMASLAARAMADRRARMFATLQGKPASYFARTPASEVLSRFSSDLAVVEAATSRLVPRAMYGALNIAACTVMMAILDLRLAGVILVGLVLAFVAPRRLGARAAVRNADRRDAEGELLATVQESVALHTVVRAFGLEGWVGKTYGGGLGRFRTHASRSTFAGSVVETFTVLAFASVQVLVLCAGAWLVIAHHLTAGQLIAFTTLIATVSASTFGLSAMIPPLIEAASGFASIAELFAGEAAPSGVHELAPLAEAIRFEHVTFSYTGERMELKDVTLAIPAGTSAAFVGPSGSGKSTALSLITRTNVPRSGRVALDGHDLREVTPASFYRQTAIVAQESLLFATTVRENIRAGRLDASDAEVEAAAKKAEVHDAIAALPHGYDSPVGERGGNLSGGQRQRIAIARAILRDPWLLVLDEATSALDPATEEAVARTLSELGRGRTIVSVTHRLSTITGYDCIFVMKDGELAESGTHEALLARDGLYRQLWEKQTGVAVAASGQASMRPAWLATVPLFAALDDGARALLADRFATMTYGADHELFRAGDPGDAFYVVARGQVAIEVPRPGMLARRQIMADGDGFGEIALLEPRARTANARTITDCTLLVLPRPHFDELLAHSPTLAAALRQKAAGHLARDVEG